MEKKTIIDGHCHLKRQNAVTITTEYCLTFVVKHIKKHTLFVYLQTQQKKKHNKKSTKKTVTSINKIVCYAVAQRES